MRIGAGRTANTMTSSHLVSLRATQGFALLGIVEVVPDGKGT